jgi:hypothetical protein
MVRFDASENVGEWWIDPWTTFALRIVPQGIIFMTVNTSCWECLKYAHENGCPLDKRTCWYASLEGQLGASLEGQLARKTG